MNEIVTLTGMVLLTSPIKEYDRRIEVLTKERGRISAFAQGARKVGSALSGCTIPLVYGEFQFYEGKNSYSLRSASIQKSFGEIAEDYDKACYAAYFTEMARVFSKENMNTEGELLLLYITLSAMLHGQMPLKLIRLVYELRMFSLTGQGLELFECLDCHRTDCHEVYFPVGGLLCPECAAKHLELKHEMSYTLSKDALYTLRFILSSPLQKVYSFLVSENLLNELERFRNVYLERLLPYPLKSMEFL